ncbi:MAG: Mur ligase family protein [Patescibacteria group bacterium]|nr:Mur ligase family protein [Patescibacteria group bacterium]
MRNTLQKILKSLASLVLKKYKPEIVGITGSVGKTGAKEAIFAVLSSKYRVRKSKGNYNNEIGVPLTILGRKTAGKNIFAWLGIFLHALNLLLFKDEKYPEILVLELAADKPGDMDYFYGFVKPKIAVVTAVAHAHTEFFKDIEGVFAEKKRIISNLKKDAYAVLSTDDVNVARMREHTQAKIITFGFKRMADIQCVDFGLDMEKDIISGVSFKLATDENESPAHLKGVVGKQPIYAALTAAAVGVIYKINLIEISESLKKIDFPAGRMRLISGIKHTMLIDDSYNASPRSVLAALEAMQKISVGKNNQKYAVLGDMAELGTYTEKGHQEVGEAIVANNIDFLITVGEKMEEAITAAVSAGMSEDKIFKFAKPEKAGLFIQGRIKKGDLVLIKGSRIMKMEKITEELMDEPLKAEKLLVR